MAEQMDPSGTALPSVGRIVHFTDEEGRTLPAVVTQADGLAVLATVLHPRRAPWVLPHPVGYDAAGSKNTWRWPPRV